MSLSLIGPLAMLPTPLAAAANPHNTPKSACGLRFCISRLMPTHVELQPPAKMPYKKAKAHRAPKFAANPQAKTTAAAAPRERMSSVTET